MQHLKRGLTFFRQAWKITRGDRLLLKPTITYFLWGLLLTVAALVLVGLFLFFSKSQLVFLILTGFLLTIIFLLQVALSDLFSIATAGLVYARLTQAEIDLPERQQSTRPDWVNVLNLSLARPGISVARLLEPNASAAPSSELTDPQPSTAIQPDKAWMHAEYLVFPIMAAEVLRVKDSLQRGAQMVRANLLPINANFVGVDRVSWLIWAGLELIGMALGIGIGLIIARLGYNLALVKTLAACLAFLIFSLFTLAASGTGAYFRTLYHTCLYRWARNVEQARLENRTEPVSVPSLLADALQVNN
jgi:hypothetical protein